MNDHIPDVTKMISDTPRMKAARNAAMEHSTGDVWRVGCDIECELNAANAEIEEKRKDIVYLATEKAKLENYVMRLEEAGDALANTQTYDLLETVNWRKSKEAKP
jgi:ethanolamine ammonia-lyase large subunit